MGYYALVKEDNTVEDIIVWDGVSNWSAPNGITLVDVTGIEVGTKHTYNPETKTFIEPPQDITPESNLAAPGESPNVIG